MKKYRAISLIETLISLAVVGIALIALLPIMTVKKDSYDATKGNGMWANGNTTASICRGGNAQCAMEVGQAQADVADLLLINSNGFVNTNLVPLNIINRLIIHGQNIESSSAPMFNAFAGLEEISLDAANYYVYHTNLYYDANKVVIQNDSIFDTAFSIIRDTADYVNADSYLRHSDNGSKYVSISNQNNEYIYNESTSWNPGGGVADIISNVVGIGVNSGKPPSATNSSNVINIFNAKNYASGEGNSGANFSGIAIGALTDNHADNYNYNNKAYFALHKDYSKEQFEVNADYFSVNGFSVGHIWINSDRRLKNIISKYKKGLNEILKIKPVEYTLKNDKEKIPHVGVIAQDFQKIFPYSVGKGPDGYLMVSEEETFYALLNSIKELDKKNKKLAEDNKKLEMKIAELRKIRDNLKASKGGKND